MNVWLNGVVTDSIAVANRGLAYGDGVFETLLFHGACCAQFDQHIARLARGLAVLGIDMPDLSWLGQLQHAAASNAYSLVKILAFRSGTAAGYGYEHQRCDVLVMLKPFQWQPSKTMALAVSDYPLVTDSRLAGIKHLNRLQQVLAASEAKAKHVDDLLVLDSNKRVIEAISSNVFFLIDDCWYTPDLSSQGVAGVMRETLINQSQEFFGQKVRVDTIAYNSVLHCQSAFLCNSVRGIMPIKSIDGRVIDTNLCQSIEKQVSQYLHA